MTVTKGGKKKTAHKHVISVVQASPHNRICNGPKVTAMYADSLEDMVYNLIAEKLQSLKALAKDFNRQFKQD